MSEQYHETGTDQTPDVDAPDAPDAAELEPDGADVVTDEERYDPTPSGQVLKDPTKGTDEAPNLPPEVDAADPEAGE